MWLRLVPLVVLALSAATFAVDAPAGAPGKAFRHVVLFKFKDGLSADQVAEVVTAFGALKGKIDLIQDFEYGTDVSVENRSQGYTHCFLATFRDDKARDAYLIHPAHKAFGQLAGPRLDKVLVVDYWSKQ